MEKAEIRISDVARVYVNSIEVGSIPLQDYLDMRRNAFRNYKNYIAQAFNYLHTAFIVMNRIIMSVPAIWFAIALIFTLFDSSIITDFFTLVQSNSPQQNTDLFIYILNRSLILSSLLTLLMFPLTGCDLTRYGFQDKFQLSVAKQLMKELGEPALGTIEITYTKKSAL
ncbi:hypothetical protein IRT38_00225 (plasmid) [Acinetobacter sp. SK-43]|uniref:hypothetical protein n=1 Tax=Acinetobacter sp. SK-43 TaxID=2785295 RepID=UPI00188CDE6D|nr:hypothetical protein [Acinetobacter sp. SK-43]MBF4453839.1 hypothetical protein [Acinetobacter sp. SK-43]